MFNVLITGGAGFIGSNLAAALLQDDRVSKVRVFDNLATGFLKNLDDIMTNPKFEFIEGDIRDIEACRAAMKDIHLVSHQAALGSVPRSVKDPLTTNAVNINGTLNIFNAAYELGIKRVVFAASSSTYGDSEGLPKVEDKIGNPLSPYAVTKLVNELYAGVYARVYGLEYIGLRYFNVFGPKQDPNGAYAAVIPLFFKAALENERPVINGDGEHSRDFTYVDNAVEANILALFTEDVQAINQIYNVACGERTSLNELWNNINAITNTSIPAIYGPNRAGDIAHSLADITKARQLLGYAAAIKVKEGLEKSFNWYHKEF
ncbi:MAG: SDR family oxidoreductase [Saprospiraceae bacterium]|nr:SDR family oxidoreductase [Saprospiraceae bacterium]MBK9688940.1 SDR family oxidoreductase [Saprospiraceae bacterium]MBL0085018.1 SDR family oxidoreductase [Saprospiraceae bacterium]